MVLYVGLIALALVALYYGGESLVSGSVRIGRRLGLSNLVLGLTVVAFGTSAPEFAVSLDAVLTGRPDMAVANVIGSNIANMALVAALIVMAGFIGVDRLLPREDIPVMLASFLAMWLALMLGMGLMLWWFVSKRSRADDVGGGVSVAADSCSPKITAKGGKPR